ncbi:MAG: copper resistance protein CopC [Rhodospirillales bacterium]|nr:copper resistance protein CopC [Rhodospirillales bacterium]MDE2200085.1 copper resistance protein CopC [Rhodospirillales bacterium]MDE2574463.1 copper resistance protein CopC [Rhodospirillales bacterium]
MTRPCRLLAALPLAFGLAVLAPRAALAHAVLVASKPAAGATVPAGPATLTLRYNSRIDRVRSRLSLTAPDHHETVLAIGRKGAADELRSTAVLAPGAYTIHWQVLAIDGHITRGDVPFKVAAP